MIIDIIKELNSEIEKAWKYVDRVINSDSTIINQQYQRDLFDEYAVFISAPQPNDNEAKKIKGRHGIYIFLLTDDVVITKEQVEGYNSLVGAKLKKEFWGKDGCGQYIINMCLYTGSCINKSLYSRLREHFGVIGSANTACLHIESPERRFLKGKVIVYAFPIRKQYEDHLRVIIPALEHQMHEQFCPIAGTSRV